MTKTEGAMSWAVLDPRRHIMNIWEKDQVDFVDAALARGASAITNGPFLRYQGGNKYQAYGGYQAVSLLGTFFFGLGSLMVPKHTKPAVSWAHSVFDQAQQIRFLGTRDSEGYIYGSAEGITETKLSRPNSHYLGRNQGRLFGDYVVERGDPPQITEVIGGLKRSVENYSPGDDKDTLALLGCWGLAPILSAPADKLILFESAGLQEALNGYEERMLKPREEDIPYGPGVESTDLCDGLIVALFGGGSTGQYSSILASVLTKEAVRVDGNGSILLATGSTALQGGTMPYYKEKYNKWGYQFMAG
jgi:hypothetical protein